MNQIQPERKYNLKEIHDLRLIPWARHYQTIRRIIGDDFVSGNILGALREGEGRLTRYSVKGKNIINYLNKAEPYLRGAVRNPKQWQQKQKRSR